MQICTNEASYHFVVKNWNTCVKMHESHSENVKWALWHSISTLEQNGCSGGDQRRTSYQ